MALIAEDDVFRAAFNQQAFGLGAPTTSKTSSMITHREWEDRCYILKNWEKEGTDGLTLQEFRRKYHNGYRLHQKFFVTIATTTTADDDDDDANADADAAHDTLQAFAKKQMGPEWRTKSRFVAHRGNVFDILHQFHVDGRHFRSSNMHNRIKKQWSNISEDLCCLFCKFCPTCSVDQGVSVTSTPKKKRPKKRKAPPSPPPKEVDDDNDNEPILGIATGGTGLQLEEEAHAENSTTMLPPPEQVDDVNDNDNDNEPILGMATGGTSLQLEEEAQVENSTTALPPPDEVDDDNDNDNDNEPILGIATGGTSLQLEEEAQEKKSRTTLVQRMARYRQTIRGYQQPPNSQQQQQQHEGNSDVSLHSLATTLIEATGQSQEARMLVAGALVAITGIIQGGGSDENTTNENMTTTRTPEIITASFLEGYVRQFETAFGLRLRSNSNDNSNTR